VDELYSYVHERVVAEMPRQRPKHQSDVEGRIVLARNPRWTLPEYLRHGLASPIADDRLTALEGLRRLHRVGNDLVRERTAAEIRRLVDDDSRRVSAAAAAWAAETESATAEPVETAGPVAEVGNPVPVETAGPVSVQPGEPVPVDTAGPVGEVQEPVPVEAGEPVPVETARPLSVEMGEPVRVDTVRPVPVGEAEAPVESGPVAPVRAPAVAAAPAVKPHPPAAHGEPEVAAPASARPGRVLPDTTGQTPYLLLTAKGDFLIAGLLLLLLAAIALGVAQGQVVAGLMVPISLLFWFFVGKGIFRWRRQRK
jgi:hypothetical protein